MKTILLFLLTLVNHCISNEDTSLLTINNSDAAQREQSINSAHAINTDHQSSLNDNAEKRMLQNEEILWQDGNSTLISVTDKFKVNTISKRVQAAVDVKVLPGANAVAYSWESFDLAGSKKEAAPKAIMLQVVNREGRPISPAIRVNPDDQNAFAPCPLLHIGNNELMAIWSGAVLRENIFRIYAKRFQLNGQPNGNYFLISDGNSRFTSQHPNAKCKEDTCVVTWHTFRPNNIYMRKLYTNGTTIGDVERVNLHVTNSELKKVAPKVVFLRNGNFLIVWLDQRNDYTQNAETYYDVYTQLIHKNGTKLLKKDLKINVFTHVPVASTVAVDNFKKSNRVIIVWEGISTNTMISRVYYRIISSDGKVINFEEALELALLNPKNTDNNRLPKRYPDVRVLVDDFYAITWASFIDQVAPSSSIVMQVFKHNSVPIGPEVNVSNEMTVNARYPKIDAFGNLITVGWESKKENLDVWARLFTFFTPTIAPTTCNFTTLSPTTVAKYPTLQLISPPPTLAVWWEESKSDFFIIIGATFVVLTLCGACHLATVLERQ